MHNPEVQKRGFVVLKDTQGLNVKHWAPRWSSQGPALARAFPLKIDLAHICNAGRGFYLLSKAVKAVLSVSQREFFLVHNETGNRLLESLSKHGLPKHCVPSSLDCGEFLNVQYFQRCYLDIF